MSFDQNLSEKFNLQCSIPQGTCLGPLLFTIYASKLFEVIKNYLPQSHTYADDTQLSYKVPAVHMSKLQRIQNSVAWLVCSTPRFNHITPILFSLHWLPVAYSIEFKILVLTFKAIYQLTRPISAI